MFAVSQNLNKHSSYSTQSIGEVLLFSKQQVSIKCTLCIYMCSELLQLLQHINNKHEAVFNLCQEKEQPIKAPPIEDELVYDMYEIVEDEMQSDLEVAAAATRLCQAKVDEDKLTSQVSTNVLNEISESQQNVRCNQKKPRLSAPGLKKATAVQHPAVDLLYMGTFKVDIATDHDGYSYDDLENCSLLQNMENSLNYKQDATQKENTKPKSTGYGGSANTAILSAQQETTTAQLEIYKCSDCNEEFFTKMGHSCHKAKQHVENTKPVQKLSTLTKKHVKNTKSVKKLPTLNCPICNIKVATSSHMAAHMTEHIYTEQGS